MPPTRVLRALTAACVLAAAVLPVTAAASVQVGSSGWQWGNPLPQGNTPPRHVLRPRRDGGHEFVAQWPGDFRSAGDGSVPLTVTVSARRG